MVRAVLVRLGLQALIVQTAAVSCCLCVAAGAGLTLVHSRLDFDSE